MTRFYTQEHLDVKSATKRTILLAAALFCDVLTLVFTLRACFGAYLYFIGTALSLIVSAALRIASLTCRMKWTYVFRDDGFCVEEHFPSKKKVVFEIGRRGAELLLKNGENCVDLYRDPCDCEIYVLKLSDGRTFGLVLNDYMLALVDELVQGER